ncbi:MAG: hypothetical protein FIB01_15435, partial [Gemmatimonadetes bacterium]|nr:hypothetical protein [Gemmatimonadota bacterium]
MTKYRLLLGAALLLTAVRALPAQEAPAPLVVGTLGTGATVSLIRSAESGKWGIDVSGPGTPHVSQAQPARVEVFAGNVAADEYFQDDIRQLASGYSSVDTAAGGVIGVAELSYDSGVRFRFEDRWSVSGAVLSVQRTVTVAGTAAGGFLSTVLLSTDPSVTWPDIDYFAPGLLYGDTIGHEDRNAGGRFSYL